MMHLLGESWCLSAWLRTLVVIAALGLAGCASVPVPNKADPLESWNRSAYEFNDVLDRNLLKPAATGYQNHVPSVVRTGVGNFFANLQDGWTAINSALQLKGQAAAESFTRFWVNTFFGLGGVLDWATEMQIPRYNEDFGQTLGYWGVGSGPYLVLPLFGPSTVRDTAALPVDWTADPVNQGSDMTLRYSATALKVVHRRSTLLRQEGLMEGAALDRYTLMRDVYLQYRRNQVYDGNPPEEPADEEQEGEPEGAPAAP